MDKEVREETEVRDGIFKAGVMMALKMDHVRAARPAPLPFHCLSLPFHCPFTALSLRLFSLNMR